MCALRMEAPVVAGVVGVKPESSLGFRLKFDEAGLVVSAVHSPQKGDPDVPDTADGSGGIAGVSRTGKRHLRPRVARIQLANSLA